MSKPPERLELLATKNVDVNAFGGRTLVWLVFAILLWSMPAARAGEGPSPDIARGEHIANAMAHCMQCHGSNLAGGRSFRTGATRASVLASNLTSGAGGVGAMYSDADFARAIRLGVRPDGSHLAVMPSENFAVLTDSDLASLLAYLRTVAPVERGTPRAARDPSSPHVVASEASPLLVAQPAALPEGAYLAHLGGCLECHGASLHGSSGPRFSAPDISSGGIGTWSAADFTVAMRTGRTPGGHVLQAPMPWRAVGRLTDAELEALYHFLEAAPAGTSPARALEN